MDRVGEGHRIRVRGTRRVTGEVRVPGDKSVSHRALMIAALASGTSKITGLSRGDDVAHTRAALELFGVAMTDAPDGVTVEGGLRHEPLDVLDCGNAGTGMRLLTGVCAGQDMSCVLTGDRFLRLRPMDRVAVPLRQMGARVDGREGGRYAPLAIHGGHLNGITYRPPVASAQVKSALLLAGLTATSPTTVVEPHPTRRHTEEMLETFGAKVAVDGASVTVWPGALAGTNVNVPGDPSQAAFWVVAGLLGGEVTTPGLYLGFGRADFLGVLRRMGAKIEVEEDSGSVRAHASHLHGVEITATDVPGIVDEIPVLAVAAAAADGVTVISGAEDLRVKESDRIATTAAMLRAFGVEVIERTDGLIIHGRDTFTAAPVNSHGDHRIAMAAAVAAATRADGDTVIEGWEAVATSYPGFAADLARLAGDDTGDA